MSLHEPPAWSGSSSDPNDEQFGDVVEPATLDRAGEFDAVLVGEPYDDAVIGRRGAREGPAALRDALAGVKTHHFDAGPVESIGDLGNVVIPDGDVSAVQETVRETTRDVHAQDALPVFLGGDNSLTYPNAAPLLSESAGIVNFDAHLDCREVQEKPTSGTPYRQLHEDGLDAYACVGARHFETSTAYAEYVDEQNGAIVTSEAVGDDPAGAVDRALDAMAGVETVYVSVDLDVLDATAAPGVSASTPGGITTRELFEALRRVAADDRVAGFEVVECAPSLDTEGRTAAAGARAVAHFLTGYTEEHDD
ncbi:formimidoylglutamase [Halococcus saccharolyticus]|uniref:Formimidoylglutamase n=1 Tax=Halococcus saccharolyticus DSM 5350 TaxID=1227455 RepID=M0MHU3_9EURY|nr:formimidoylglutamase [Halococcus saccharolyticus]EMA44908.1 formimidoylglutamase [Halococcus saccharolyticus DSM 5350]